MEVWYVSLIWKMLSVVRDDLMKKKKLDEMAAKAKQHQRESSHGIDKKLNVHQR